MKKYLISYYSGKICQFSTLVKNENYDSAFSSAELNLFRHFNGLPKWVNKKEFKIEIKII